MSILKRHALSALLWGLICLLLSVCNLGFAAEPLKLKNLEMAQTENGRDLLKYLINCALKSDVTVKIEASGKAFEFRGDLGLVPQWSSRALTLEEEQIISACILARTNFFGKPVNLSLRSETLQSLQVGEKEALEFPFFEAAFFGNIFKAEPEYYVCSGDTQIDRIKRLEFRLRVCSLAPAIDNGSGKTRCGFTNVGSCASKPFFQNGRDYSDSVLRVFLPVVD